MQYQPPPPDPDQEILNYRSNNLQSEAEVRVAIDFIQHSNSEMGIKLQQKAALLARLGSLTAKGATQRKQR